MHLFVSVIFGLAASLTVPCAVAKGTRGLQNEVTYTITSPLKGEFNVGLDGAVKDALLSSLRNCVDAYDVGQCTDTDCECDVYFNPHTDYSFYRNPSAVGVLRGQLYYSGDESDGELGKVFTFSTRDATSENIDNVMEETGLQQSGGAPVDCIGAKHNPLGPGVARAEGTVVVWYAGDPDVTTDDEIFLEESTIILKDIKTKDIRCKFCLNTSGKGLGCDDIFDNTDYSNTNLIGSHLHNGNNFTDGPPSVFFCKNVAGAVLNPNFLPSDFTVCPTVYN